MLLELGEESFRRVRDKVAGVVRDHEPGSERGDVFLLAVEERNVIEVFHRDIAEHGVCPGVEVRRESPQEFQFYLLFQALVVGVVILVFRVLVADTPVLAGEREKVHVEVQPEAVLREDRVAPDA